MQLCMMSRMDSMYTCVHASKAWIRQVKTASQDCMQGPAFQQGRLHLVLWFDGAIVEQLAGFCEANNIVNILAVHDESDNSQSHLVDPAAILGNAAEAALTRDRSVGRVANKRELALLRLTGVPLCGQGCRVFSHVNVR